MQLNPYLTFKGECEAAFKFYEKAIGGKLESIFPYEGTPAGEHVPLEWRKKIMHAQLRIGDELLMGSDAEPSRYETPRGFSVTLNIEDPSQAEKVFNALSDNASIKLPIQETFWARRFGMLVDRFGIPWMVNCEKPAA